MKFPLSFTLQRMRTEASRRPGRGAEPPEQEIIHMAQSKTEMSQELLRVSPEGDRARNSGLKRGKVRSKRPTAPRVKDVPTEQNPDHCPECT